MWGARWAGRAAGWCGTRGASLVHRGSRVRRQEAETSLQSALFILGDNLFLPVDAFPLPCEEYLDGLLYVSFFPNTFLLILFCDLTRSLYSSELIALTSSEEHWGGGQAACHLSHEISTSMETPISLLVKLCTPLGRIFSWSVWGGLLSAGTAPWILLREE